MRSGSLEITLKLETVVIHNFILGVNRSNGRKLNLKIGRGNWIGREKGRGWKVGRGKERGWKVGKRREEKVGKEEEKEKKYIVQIPTFKNLFLIL